MSTAGRSDEQQAAEPAMLDLLARETGLTYRSERIRCGDEYVEIDGVGRDASGAVVELVEVYARQGRLGGSQLKKPTDDAARLMLACIHVEGNPKLRLAWGSSEAIEQIENGWRGLALAEMGVEFVHVDLDDETEASIREAQKRQFR